MAWACRITSRLGNTTTALCVLTYIRWWLGSSENGDNALRFTGLCFCRQSNSGLTAIYPDAFRATSSSRLFGPPTAAHPCPDSDPPPASAGARSHPAVAWLPVPGSDPSRRISPSTRRNSVSILPLRMPHPRPSAQPPVASAPRSSALPCACSSTYPLPISFAQIMLSFVRAQGSRSLRSLSKRRQRGDDEWLQDSADSQLRT